MIVLGAGGFAKQLLEVILQTPTFDRPIFFDDKNALESIDLRHEFSILRSWEEVAEHFAHNPEFVVGTGNPSDRKMLFEKAIGLGGKPLSVVSHRARISSQHTRIGIGVCILDDVVIESFAQIGDGVLLNLKSAVTHDCIVGDFSEIGPMACVLGKCHIGQEVSIGAGAIVLPSLTINSKAVVAAGAVVVEDVAAQHVVAGTPAKRIQAKSPMLTPLMPILEATPNRILVVTDNEVLLTAFQELMSGAHPHSITYVHSHTNANPQHLQRRGCTPLNVKKEVESILSGYDMVFSLHCKQIFPEKLVNGVKCINLHPGLNPFNRGWYPQVFSIVNGLPAGATIHEMVNEVDRGPVIAQMQVPIKPWDTSLSVYQKVMEAEVELLKVHLPSILAGTYSAAPTEDGNYNSISDFKALCPIDLNEKGTFGEFIDRLRALSHPPFRNAHFVTAEGKKVFLNLELFPDNAPKP